MNFHVKNGSFAGALLTAGLALPGMALGEAATEATGSNASEAVESANSGLQEIVVTAQRRSENIQDVGVAVTALDSAALQRVGISNATDIASRIPNLRFISLGSSVVNYNIRGVSQNDFTDHLEPPIALYVDDSYLSTATQASLPIFDMQRVEVLRGPQGTLFGRNATGGLIHFISNQPSKTEEGYVDVTLGDDGYGRVEAAMGGPIAENLQGRVAVAVSSHEGYVENQTEEGGKLGSEHYVAMRAILAWQPTSTLDVDFNVRYYQNYDQSGAPYSFAPTIADSQGLGRFVGPNENPYGTCNGCGPAYYNGYKQPDPYKGAYTTIGHFNRDAVGATLKFDFDLGDNTHLVSISDYQHLNKNYFEDVDDAPEAIATDLHMQTLEQATQEVRMSGSTDRIRWSDGVYLYYQRSSTLTHYNLFEGEVLPTSTAYIPSKSGAVYAQGEYDFAPTLTGIVGGRYTRDEKSIDFRVVDPTSAYPSFYFNPYTQPQLAKETFNLYSAKAELQWKPVARTLFYASFNRGVKGGGYGLPGYLPISPETPPFKAETLYAYEVGEKWTSSGGLLRVNTSLYYYDYKNYQAFNFQTVNGLPVGTIVNRDAHAKGIETEIVLTPLTGLTLSANLAGMNSAVKNVVLPDGEIVTRTLPQAPSFSGNAMARYEMPVLTNKVAALQFDVDYNGRQSFTVLSAPDEQEKAYSIGDLRLSLASNTGQWETALYVKNVWDTQYRIFAYDLSSLGTIAQAYNRPRSVGVSFRRNF